MADLSPMPIDADMSGVGIRVRTLATGGQWIVTGSDLTPNTIDVGPPARVWLAPDRCLVVAETATTSPEEYFVSDVTDGFVILDITGKNAAALLTMASPLDPAVLAPGSCAQTLFAGVKVIVYPHGDGLRLHVERALAQWLIAWIARAVTSFAAQMPDPTDAPTRG